VSQFTRTLTRILMACNLSVLNMHQLYNISVRFAILLATA